MYSYTARDFELTREMKIGQTPLAEYDCDGSFGKIFVKQEQLNGSGSVKDRAAYRIVASAASKGLLNKGGLIVEATSGNMGIALSYVANRLGLKTLLTMPDTMSLGRRRLLKRYGAELVLTDGSKGMRGAIEVAEQIAKDRNGLYTRQFENNDNFLAHYFTTAEEILKQCPRVDVFVAGVGTGGTLQGVAKRLREVNPSVEIVAVEPAESAVLSGKCSGKHLIEGIGAGFKPPLLEVGLIDRIMQVGGHEAIEASRRLNGKGYFVGYSSGANLVAAERIATDVNYSGKNIVTLFPDCVDRYM